MKDFRTVAQRMQAMQKMNLYRGKNKLPRWVLLGVVAGML